MLGIVEHKPGEILILKAKGLPAHLGARFIISILVLPWIVLLGRTFLNTIREMRIEIQQANVFGALIILLFVVILISAWIAILYVMAGCTRIVVDQQKQQILISNGDLYRRTRTVPFSSIRRFRFEIGAEAAKTQLLNIKLLLKYGESEEVSTEYKEDITVEACDRRTEAVDLALQIGRMLRWEGYRVHRNDPRKLQISLQRSAESKGAVAIPLGLGELSFAKDLTPRHVPDIELKVPKFSPDKLRLSSPTVPQITWKPGTEVRIVIPGSPPLGLVGGLIGMVMTGAIFGLLISWVLNQFLTNPLNPLFTMGAAALLLCIIFLLSDKQTNREQEFHLDWSRKIATFRTGKRNLEASFADIKELVLRGESKRISGKHAKSYTKYRCELDVVLNGSEKTIIRTEEFEDEPDVPYKMTLPMIVELARSLNVPWRWEEY